MTEKKFLVSVFFMSYCVASGDLIVASTQSEVVGVNKKVDISWIKKLFDNFHSVQSGVIYRCSQLSHQRLKRYVHRIGIKTIINLRGENQSMQWWQEERDLAQECSLHFYNIPMCARTLPSKENLLKLLSIYETAPRPILLHCYSGADRTGEAAALWVIEQQKQSKEIALKHLSFRYGHIKSRRPAKHFFINLWQDKEWLMQRYNPKDYPQFC
ncbi:MAG: tyrosine-protein phosphatase [Candidatus Babeliales bacterium]